MNVFRALSCVIASAFLNGCGGNGTIQSDSTSMLGSQDSAAVTARCPVCAHNADLACLDVKVTPETPHAEYQGVTYYFCSEDCHRAFVKNPAKYR
jgi:hypothetical protein